MLIFNVAGLVLGLLSCFLGLFVLIVTRSFGLGVLSMAALLFWKGGKSRDSKTGEEKPAPSIYFVPLRYWAVPVTLIALIGFKVDYEQWTRDDDQIAGNSDLRRELSPIDSADMRTLEEFEATVDGDGVAARIDPNANVPVAAVTSLPTDATNRVTWNLSLLSDWFELAERPHFDSEREAFVVGFEALTGGSCRVARSPDSGEFTGFVFQASLADSYRRTIHNAVDPWYAASDPLGVQQYDIDPQLVYPIDPASATKNNFHLSHLVYVHPASWQQGDSVQLVIAPGLDESVRGRVANVTLTLH